MIVIHLASIEGLANGLVCECLNLFSDRDMTAIAFIYNYFCNDSTAIDIMKRTKIIC